MCVQPECGLCWLMLGIKKSHVQDYSGQHDLAAYFQRLLQCTTDLQHAIGCYNLHLTMPAPLGALNLPTLNRCISGSSGLSKQTRRLSQVVLAGCTATHVCQGPFANSICMEDPVLLYKSTRMHSSFLPLAIL